MPRFLVLLFVALLAPSAALAHGPSGSNPPTGLPPRQEVTFGTASSLASGNCLTANPSGISAGAACTGTTTVTRPLNVVGRPKIVRLTCYLGAASSGHAAGETATFTPVWVQGDGTGVVNQTDADVTVVFADADDQLGDQVTNSTESALSPYTGAQALRVRLNIAGGDGITSVGSTLCSVVVQDNP